MAVGSRIDPYSSFLFAVEIDGIHQGQFRECTGLGSTVEVIENPEGGRAQVSKIPGRVKFPNIVLKWGLTDSTELYDWHRAALTGNIQRKNGSIIQLDFQGNEKARWGQRPERGDAGDRARGSRAVMTAPGPGGA
jgi:phage tail-like protein